MSQCSLTPFGFYKDGGIDSIYSLDLYDFHYFSFSEKSLQPYYRAMFYGSEIHWLLPIYFESYMGFCDIVDDISGDWLSSFHVDSTFGFGNFDTIQNGSSRLSSLANLNHSDGQLNTFLSPYVPQYYYYYFKTSFDKPYSIHNHFEDTYINLFNLGLFPYPLLKLEEYDQLKFKNLLIASNYFGSFFDSSLPSYLTNLKNYHFLPKVK